MAVARKLFFPGVFKLFGNLTDSNPGTEQTLLNETVPVGKTWRLLRASLSHRFCTRWTLFIDSTLVASGELGPGYPVDVFEWISGRDVNAGAILTLKARVNSNSPVDKLGYHVELREF